MYRKPPEQCKQMFDKPNANKNRDVPSSLYYFVDAATGRATGEHEDALSDRVDPTGTGQRSYAE